VYKKGNREMRTQEIIKMWLCIDKEEQKRGLKKEKGGKAQIGAGTISTKA
jgi:hypothetical protein